MQHPSNIFFAIATQAMIWNQRLISLWRTKPQLLINTASFVAVTGAATPQIAYTARKGGELSAKYSLL
ncbi:MAG TPA: hypothetical protein V6D10_17425 [Trichocoleus sp.]|jgi:hypothetical protein